MMINYTIRQRCPEGHLYRKVSAIHNLIILYSKMQAFFYHLRTASLGYFVSSGSRWRAMWIRALQRLCEQAHSALYVRIPAVLVVRVYFARHVIRPLDRS